MEKIKQSLLKLVRWQYFPLLVLVLVTLGLHLATINSPSEPLFDEQHYVPDARRIITGEGTQRPEHPPLAKLIIAGGIELFGDNPWGWRMPAVLLSTVALMAFYDICRRLGTSHKTAFVATLLLGTENLMFIHSGMAMLDIYVVVFAIFAFWAYLLGPRRWWLASIFIALAGLSKFSGILSVIPIGLHWFFIGYRQNMGKEAEQAEVAVLPDGSMQANAAESASACTTASDNQISGDTPAAPVSTEPAPKRTFWQTYSRPLTFIFSMMIAPIAFFLFYWVFEMIIWYKWIPLFSWGHWDMGLVGVIKNALSLTSSIKFSYDGAFPARPWEWILSPTGSLYFYGWLFHPENYDNILIPYWYTPSYTGMINPSIWLGGLLTIPFAIWKSFQKKERDGSQNTIRNTAIFTVCWIIGTWLVWVPLFLATNRITYMFYYLPTVGAIAMGTALIIAAFLRKIEKRDSGFLKRFMQLGIASFLVIHLLAFCVLSPLHLWLSIPLCALLLFFSLWYLGFGWRFIAQFFAAGGLATLIMRFGFYWALKGWLVTGNAPWGAPEVSLLWVVSILAGMAITWLFFAVIHRVVNRIIAKLNVSPESKLTVM